MTVGWDAYAHLTTFLEWHAYGTPFTRLHRGNACPVFAKHPLVKDTVSLTVEAQNVVETTFDLTSEDGQPILFLRADWLDSISDSLTLRIRQNGETLHELKGNEHTIYQRIEDICVGGYIDGDLYRAYWLLPLQREIGQHCLRIELVSGGTQLSILPESAIEIWPEWETIEAPEEE